MKIYKIIIIIIIFLIILAGGYFILKYLGYFPKTTQNESLATIPSENQQTVTDTPSIPPAQNEKVLADPTADFTTRITKKPFGIYITPENSPIKPEKFTGYHTGVDAEYSDITDDTPVYAVSDGVVKYSGIVSGYGGVLVINENINGEDILCLYGHLAPSSLVNNGTTVTKGEQIGIVGKAYSSETDGERKHLHFSMIKGENIDFRGYVPTQNELSGWYNPLDYFEN